jgi:NAD(P)-dependent dehydrogenase (short-subunit alcohol dehydrogenase family)
VFLEAYGEGLAQEVAQFNIKVLICEPGGFLTSSIQNVNSASMGLAKEIPDYDVLRQERSTVRDGIEKTYVGDPKKGMKVLVDIVTEEGVAEGRRWPLYLWLGTQAHGAVENQLQRVRKTYEEWKDVTTDLDFDTAP